MKKTLINKILAPVLGGILTLSIGLTPQGCITPSKQAAIIGAGLESAARTRKDMTQKQRDSAMTLSNFMYSLSNIESRKEAAKIQAEKEEGPFNVMRPAGKDVSQDSQQQSYSSSNSNERQYVYVKQESPKYIPPRRQYFFACNYYKDFNPDDGGANYPEEFVGIKNKFRDDEELVLVSYDTEIKKGQTVKINIYNPHGEMFYENEVTDDTENNGLVTYSYDLISSFLIDKKNEIEDEFDREDNFSDENIEKMSLEDLKTWLKKFHKRFSEVVPYVHGNYKAVWYVDNKYAGSTEFEIIPGRLKNMINQKHERELKYLEEMMARERKLQKIKTELRNNK